MYRYSWVAVYRDGSQQQRYNEDGTENLPRHKEVEEFHLLPAPDAIERGLRPVSIFLKPHQELVYARRGHIDKTVTVDGVSTSPALDVIFVVGTRETVYVRTEDGFEPRKRECAVLLLPDGRTEICDDFLRNTRFERNLDVHPLEFFESWSPDSTL